MYSPIKLKYNLDELIPYLDYETLDIHYNKIYKKYVNELNKLLGDMKYNYKYSLKYLIRNIDKIPLSIRSDVLYYLGGVLNHSLYFYNISDKKNIIPVDKIKDDIDKYYGDYDNFKKLFISSASKIRGSGYTFLVIDNDKKLKIINLSNQESPYSYGYIPVISLDLWEHAYYLQYKNNREEYVKNFFNIIDFHNINKYYKKITSQL